MNSTSAIVHSMVSPSGLWIRHGIFDFAGRLFDAAFRLVLLGVRFQRRVAGDIATDLLDFTFRFVALSVARQVPARREARDQNCAEHQWSHDAVLTHGPYHGSCRASLGCSGPWYGPAS